MVNPDFEIRPSILVGDSSDIFLQRTQTILRNEGVNPTVSMEFSAERAGVFCGIREVRVLLTKVLPETGSEVWALEEGEELANDSPGRRLRFGGAPMSTFGVRADIFQGGAECPLIAKSGHWHHTELGSFPYKPPVAITSSF